MSGSMASPVIGGPAPSVTTVNPIYQNMIQRFSAMTPEQLRQAVAYLGPSTYAGRIASQVLQQQQMLPNARPQPPAPGAPATTAAPPPATGIAAPSMGGAPMASAPNSSMSAELAGLGGGMSAAPGGMKRGGGVQHMAGGGNPMGIGIGMADPWWTRHEAFSADAGLLHSAIPGRTDHIPASPATDSFVIPADVVSGLGEGNTLAGAKALTLALRMGPYGTPMPRGGPHFARPIPRPDVQRVPAYESKGGPTGNVPIAAAGGEFIVPPEVVRREGGGDPDKGHKALHAFVIMARRQIIKDMKKLKPPVKS